MSDTSNSSEREVLQVREYQQISVSADRLLSNGQLRLYPEVAEKDFIRARFSGQELKIQPGPYVGLIPLNDDISLEIQPRVPISNLSRLFRVTEREPVELENFLREYEEQTGSMSSYIDFMAESLLRSIRRLNVEGKHQNYQREVKRGSFPKGNIHFGRTVKELKSKGIDHELIYSNFVRSKDNNLNRCVKYTIHYLLMRYRSMEEGRKNKIKYISQLNKRFRDFRGVKLDHSESFLRDEKVSDTNLIGKKYSAYKRIIPICKAIIKDKGIKLESFRGDIKASSILVKVDLVFEDYNRNMLKKELGKNSKIRVLDGNKDGKNGAKKPLFDNKNEPEATPDIVIEKESSGEYEIVIEVKYKPVPKNRYPKRSDMNQLIAYSSSYKSKKAVLLHLSKEKEYWQKIGNIGSTDFYKYGFCIGADDIEDQDTKLADFIRSLIE